MKKVLSIVLAIAVALLCFAGCNKTETENKALTVAASTAPHAEILAECVSALAEKGYTLTVKAMDDYVLPNTATESGDVDANYFQHVPYLEQFNEENKTHLVSVAKVHYEPFGIYAGKTTSLDALKDGATVAVPNDVTNEARALLLLEANGLITLKEGAGLTATKADITSNPKNLEIKEIEAALVPGKLSEVDLGVVNGNYAISAGLKVANALAVEDANSTAAQTFANVLVVKEGNENNEAVKALVEVLQSEAIQKFITEKYEGAVVPIK